MGPTETRDELHGLLVVMASLSHGLEQMLGRGADTVTFRAGKTVGLKSNAGAQESDILTALGPDRFVEFTTLFRPEEGRMGVAVTFIAILELVREGLIDIVQNELFAPLHVRAGNPARSGRRSLR